MVDALQLAREYLTPPKDSFWEWSKVGEALDAEAIVWRDGRTIAFREELRQILELLAPRGLPPLGCVAFVLASVRDNWIEAPNLLEILDGVLRPTTRESRNLLTDAIGGLHRIASMPPALRSAPRHKAALIEAVTESAIRTTPPETEAILDTLRPGIADVLSAANDWRGQVIDDLRLMRDGLRRFDAEAFRLRFETGLEELPEPAEFELPPAERVRALLTSLEQDDELAGLARLARQLMAAVTLPRPVSEPDELPIGGVSDITNRGPLDRLLLSELAHDDLTLAVRVAVNEALYLRREAPPKTPPRQRALLLDAGIRTWGAPRVFATAVALALAATADKEHTLVSFRAEGTRATPIDLTTRDGLVQHLAALSTDLHPGAALPDFSRQLAAADSASEPVLIVTDDTLRDADFQRALDGLEAKPLFVAAVARDGQLEIIERGARGSKRLRSATLNLDVLLPGARRSKPLVNPDRAVDLPAIFGVEPFPLLLPHNIDPQRIWRCCDGVLALTHDLRLMYWTDKALGAAQITDRAPRGRLWWHSHDADPEPPRAVVGDGRTGNFALLRFVPVRNACRIVRLPQVDRPVRAVCAHHGALLFVNENKVVACSDSSGEEIASVALPTYMRWIAGRFFRAEPNQRWHALSFDGIAPQLPPLLNERAEMNCPRLTTFFERYGVDGPIGVSAGGHLYYSAAGKLVQVPHGLKGDVRVAEVAPGGKKLVLQNLDPRRAALRQMIVDVDTREVEACSSSPCQLAQRELREFAQPQNLRHRFSHVCVEGTVSLSLVPKRARAPQLTIRHEPHYGHLRLQPAGEAYVRSRPIPFQPVASPEGTGYKLHAATWPDGSRAFLDSRGLLHLKSADPDLPETSIVLCDGPLSGWSSDGRVWGLPYYIYRENASRVAPIEILKQNIQAFVERLPC